MPSKTAELLNAFTTHHAQLSGCASVFVDRFAVGSERGHDALSPGIRRRFRPLRYLRDGGVEASARRVHHDRHPVLMRKPPGSAWATYMF